MTRFSEVYIDARHRLLENEGFGNIFVTEDHVHGLKMVLKDRVTLWASSDFEAFIIAKPGRTVEQWQDAFNQMRNDGTLDNIAAK